MDRKVSNEDAKDLVQAFFTRALGRNFFRQFDPSKSGRHYFFAVMLPRSIPGAVAGYAIQQYPVH